MNIKIFCLVGIIITITYISHIILIAMIFAIVTNGWNHFLYMLIPGVLIGSMLMFPTLALYIFCIICILCVQRRISYKRRRIYIPRKYVIPYTRYNNTYTDIVIIIQGEM